jgi:nanoRNase/pAp phosphatase (c-di-AMP/oligoRNAs hydrolase)
LAEKVGVESQIAYKGMIGRAENKALVRYLAHPLLQLRTTDLDRERPIALVDTQPGAGNNALPSSRVAAVVLDHHPLREETTTAGFADVRPELGSTATMLTEYLQSAEMEPSSRLATALFYGIKADTQGLVRRASPADVAAYIYLQPLVDIEALAEIERAQVSIEYFRRLDAALHAARIYDNIILSYIGAMQRPDLAAEMADLLMRLKGVQWVICMGVHKNELILAVRTISRRGGAGQVVQAIVGDEGTAGGHGNMAGGQIPLRGADPEQLAHTLGERALHHLKVAETTGRPLMD